MGDMDHGARDLLPSFCGMRHRRAGLHGACLAVRVGWLRWATLFLTGHPVAEQSAELSPSNRSMG